MNATRTPSAAEITALLRSMPDVDAPPAEHTAWLARKAELLAAVEAAEATR